MDRPAKETFLEAVRLPDGGGPNTSFCNLYVGYEALDETDRMLVDGLVGHHSLHTASHYSTPIGDETELARRRAQANPALTYPDNGTGAWHRAVAVHPETGRRARI